MARNPWTNDELEFVENNYLKYSDLELSEILKTHTEESIATKRRRMGWIRDEHLYSYDDAVCLFKEKGYELISQREDYVNVNSKLRYICPKHGEKSMALSKLMMGRGCYDCGRERTIEARKVKFDDDEYKKICDNLDYTYVSAERMIKGKSKIICLNFICNKHKEYGVQNANMYNLRKGTEACVYCNRKNLPKTYIESELNDIVPHIEVLSEFKKLTDRVDCICKKHNYLNNTTIQGLLLGKGCKFCGIEKLSVSSMLDKQEIQDRIHKTCETIDIIGSYNGSHEYHTFKCRKCQHEWTGRIQVKMRCSNCGIKYYGESAIKDSLNDLNLNYVCQKTFKDCRDKHPLPFDFYLPDYKICIEYNGAQHYKPIEYFGGEEAFKIRQSHDKIKRDYCNNHGYTLVEIPYTVNAIEDIRSIIIDNII